MRTTITPAEFKASLRQEQKERHARIQKARMDAHIHKTLAEFPPPPLSPAQIDRLRFLFRAQP